MKKVSKKCQYDISEWLYNTRDCVSVEPAAGLFNYDCYNNAVQYAKDNEGSTVVMGITVDGNDYTTLHFWNTDVEGNHIETTLGWRAEKFTYYPLRTIPEDNHAAICTVFDDALKYFTNRFTTRWQRLLLRGKRIL